MNKIIIFKEKHGDRYFDASTPEKLNAACFKILKERFENGEYEWLSEEEPEAINILTDEQIEALPTERLKNDELRRKKNYEQEYKWRKQEKDMFKEIASCVKSESKQYAYNLLYERKGGEYENFEIETLEEA